MRFPFYESSSKKSECNYLTISTIRRCDWDEVHRAYEIQLRGEGAAFLQILMVLVSKVLGQVVRQGLSYQKVTNFLIAFEMETIYG